MSEYQYYEFCGLSMPMTETMRREMECLSSRVKVGTHGASFVYDYGDFPGDPIKILSSYFDVFFYLSNFGSFQLVFKYPVSEIDLPAIKQYCFDDLIRIHLQKQHILLDIHFYHEDGFGWCEGEGLLPYLLPVYDQVKNRNYNFLKLVIKTYQMMTNECQGLKLPKKISPAEKTFLECVGF